MNQLHALCRQVVNETDGAVACGVVDLAAAKMGLHHTVGELSREDLSNMAKAVVQILTGPRLPGLEKALAKETAGNPAAEVFMGTPSAFYFIKSVAEKQKAFVLITTVSANQALSWVSLRRAISDFKASVGLEASQTVRASQPQPPSRPESTRDSSRLQARPNDTQRLRSGERRRLEAQSLHSAGGLTHRNPAVARSFPTLGGR